MQLLYTLGFFPHNTPYNTRIIKIMSKLISLPKSCSLQKTWFIKKKNPNIITKQFYVLPLRQQFYYYIKKTQFN